MKKFILTLINNYIIIKDSTVVGLPPTRWPTENAIVKPLPYQLLNTQYTDLRVGSDEWMSMKAARRGLNN